MLGGRAASLGAAGSLHVAGGRGGTYKTRHIARFRRRLPRRGAAGAGCESRPGKRTITCIAGDLYRFGTDSV